MKIRSTWARLKPPRWHQEAGATYTFIVLAATVTLLMISATMLKPGEHVLKLNHIRHYRLSSTFLARSGIAWCSGQSELQPGERKLQLSTGEVLLQTTALNAPEGTSRVQVTVSGLADQKFEKELQPTVIKAVFEKLGERYTLVGIVDIVGQVVDARTGLDAPPDKSEEKSNFPPPKAPTDEKDNKSDKPDAPKPATPKTDETKPIRRRF